jgi:hypothetical protein
MPADSVFGRHIKDLVDAKNSHWQRRAHIRELMRAGMSDLSDGLDRLGKDARKIARGLREFSESAQIFSSDVHRLIDSWVAVRKGGVLAVADSLEELTEQIEHKHIPTSQTLIRFIDREPKTPILQRMIRGRFGNTSGRRDIKAFLHMPITPERVPEALRKV